ncbi:MAG: hypothetical protein M1838_002392 [Thelocarpon superellum]|nr:MAG: hypothetical protein M1838_002392 [Thelocarpon superellum]
MSKSTRDDHVRERHFARSEDDSVHMDSVSAVRDERDLASAGKKPQLKPWGLQRNFGFVSTFAFSTTLMATWEGVGSAFAAGLLNGGPTSLVYGYILSFIGTMATAASLAEMASIIPASGGQYHWTAKFAPARWAVLLSWIEGWISILGWQAVTASVVFLGATQIQGLLVLNYESYVFERWHGTLLYTAIILLSVSVNVIGIKILPHIESVILILHFAFYFILLVPLVYLSRQSSSEFVWTQFMNNGGWDNDGVSWCIGLMSATYPFICYDGACHMSEEVENASVVVPRTLLTSILINGAMGFGFLLALLYSIGDVDSVLNSPTGYPIIQIFYNATQSNAAASAMMGPMIAVAAFASFGMLAAASRVTWAFARDKGLPCAQYFAYVEPRLSIPIRAIMLSACIVFVLGLVNIGSTTAFNAIISLATVALYVSYVIPIILLAMRRLSGEPIRFGPFSLGRYGLATNIFAIIYSIFIAIFLFFPPVQPVTSANMNYSSVMFGGVLIIAMISWFVYGKRIYRGPIDEVGNQQYRSD